MLFVFGRRNVTATVRCRSQRIRLGLVFSQLHDADVPTFGDDNMALLLTCDTIQGD